MTIEPIQQLHLKRFYTDTNGSQVRAEIRAANRAQTRPLKTFLTSIADFADRAVHFQDRYAARCGIDALSTWARAGALLGKMPTKQGEHHRKWALTGLALSYLKLKPWTTLEDRNRINPWLQAMADDALVVFENPKIKRNNHLYWLGLALAAVGESTASDRHWDQAEAILDEALDGIPSSGMLPLEMARGAKALHYHVFAVTPLVVLEWLARQSGRPVASTQRVALDRLIDRTLEGVSDPSWFERTSGVPQHLPSNRANFAGYGWPVLIDPDGTTRRQSLILPNYARSHRWLGGDIRALLAAVKTR